MECLEKKTIAYEGGTWRQELRVRIDVMSVE